MEEKKIIAQRDAKVNDADRLALASLLVKFGYTVRIGKERKDGKTTNVVYIAYKGET
jgi:hypothetical protein